MNIYVRRAKNAQKETIPMLLDIEHFYGENQGSLGPLLSTLLLLCVPPLIYMYFGLWNIIPIPIFVILAIFYAIRVVMIIPGREAYRLESYRKSLYEDYQEAASLVNIRTIHSGTGTLQDGLVEYTNGFIAYYVIAYNGTIPNDDQHARAVKRLIETMAGKHMFDIHVLNDTQTSNLYAYYKKVSNFSKNEAATNFIKILDYCMKQTKERSMVQGILFVIKGRRSDWKEIRISIQNALNSRDAKSYNSIKLLTTDEEISAIINRDADTIVNIQDLLRKKYKTGEYGESKVLKFDVKESDSIQLGTEPTQNILPQTARNSFHVRYEDTKEDEVVLEEV